MGRRQFLKLAGAGAGALALSHSFAGKRVEASPTRRPNIVFVFPDQFRQDMSKFIATPNIDRLAREGMRFPNALSCTPLCTPFRGMLMTGRYPTHSGLVMNWVEASPVQNPNCLANVFSKAGYDTAYIGKWHLAAGLLKGAGLFEPNQEAIKGYVKRHPETEYVPPGPARLGFHFWQAYNFHVAFNDYWYYEDSPQRMHSKEYETNTEIDQAIAYMERHKNQEKPFLLVVAPHPPHPPFWPISLPGGYLDKVPKAEDLYRPPNVPAQNNPRKPEELRIYLAMAKNFDDELGRLIAYLDQSDVGENTILVVTSDHGEMHGSHGRTDKMVPYAEAVNVPLVMRWPGKIPAGITSDVLYTPIDHFPTLCGLVGVKPPSELDGEDLSQVICGQGRSYREAVLMANYTSHWDYFQTGTNWPEWRGVHTKRHTYVKWLRGSEELYDNLEDPFQIRNLAEEASAKTTLEELRLRLKQLMATAHDDWLTGRELATWYDAERNLIQTALGPVHR
jgi:arylsulfatase A-like enzyme